MSNFYKPYPKEFYALNELFPKEFLEKHFFKKRRYEDAEVANYSICNALLEAGYESSWVLELANNNHIDPPLCAALQRTVKRIRLR